MNINQNFGSAMNNLRLTEGSPSISTDGAGTITTFKYISDLDHCIRGMNQDFKQGMESQEYGTVKSSTIEHQEGPWYILTVVWEKEGEEADGSGEGPQKSNLTTRMISMPLETHPNYRRNWNYDLWYIGPNGDLPVEYFNNIYMNVGTNFPWDYQFLVQNGTSRWLVQFGDSMPEKPYQGEFSNASYMWQLWRVRSKPGQEYWLKPQFEMTRYGHYEEKEQAGWAVAKRIGKIRNLDNDFEIVSKFGGNWLCEGASIQWDGKQWVAESTYLHSGDELGWDKDLYEEV